MAQFKNMFPVDLSTGPARVQLHQMYKGDKLANRFGAIVTNNGAPVELGGTCSGTALLNNGGTVALTGVISGNQAYVDLSAACYSVEGPIWISVTWTSGDVETTLIKGMGNVEIKETTAIIDDYLSDTIAELIQEIQQTAATIPLDYSALDNLAKSQSAILSLSNEVALPFAVDATGAVNATTGNISSSSTFSHTDYIDVSAYAYLSYKRIGIVSSTITAGVAWYDSSKTYISGIRGVGSQAEAGYLDGVALVPDNAKFARFTVFTDTGSRGAFSATGYSHPAAEAEANLEAFDARVIPPTMLAQGSIAATTGENDSSTDTGHGKRVRTPRRVHRSVRRVVADSGYSVSAFAYSKADDTYIGRVVTAGTLSKISNTDNTLAWLREIDLWTLRTIWPGYYWRLMFRKDDDSDQEPADIAPHITYVIDREQASGAFFPTQRIPATCSGVYALYDAFVTAGIATKTTLATVEGLPIYQYDFKALDGWMDGEDYEIDTSGNRLFPKYQILFTSGMHGDEKSAVLGLYEFMNLVANDPQYVRNLALCDIHVIPVCNPTGYNANSRNNYQGKNINRLDTDTETGGGNTVEAIAIKAVIDSQAYDLYIDLHNMRTDTASASTPGASGGMSFANATPEALMTKEYRTYMEATTHTTQVMLDELSDITNNARQAFYPWRGQNVNSFRQYALTHQSGGVNVGSPVSGTFEVSRRCYSLTQNNVDYNGYAIQICDQCAIDVLGTFIDRVTEGRL